MWAIKKCLPNLERQKYNSLCYQEWEKQSVVTQCIMNWNLTLASQFWYSRLFKIKFICNSCVLDSVPIFQWKKTNARSVVQYQWNCYRIFVYLVRALIPMKGMWRQPMHERKTNTVFSLPLQLVTGRTNGRDFENAPSLSLSVFHSTTPSSFFFHFFSPPSSLPTCLQMANAILDVFFLHIKPEVTAALFLNQPQMCRHSYLTTGADGTLSEAGSEKYKKKTSVV